MKLLDHLGAARGTSAEVAARYGAVRDTLQRDAPYLRIGDFRRISARTLRQLFDAYDHAYLGGSLQAAIAQQSARIDFRLSPRMTRIGGKTTMVRPRGGPPAYEIAVSTTLLFHTFAAVDRTITVAGMRCTDRLDALQRIFEHELVHLIEFVAWSDSSCRQRRFADIARRLFGHREVTHQLVTPGEAAAVNHGIRVGDRVCFLFEGRNHVGVVNRITHRATVLVESPGGELYDDGHRYRKYYVPLAALEKAG